MKNLNKIVIVLFFLISANILTAQERIVIIGHGLTEIVYALGFGDKVVGVDDQSTYPPETKELPKVGYYESVNATQIKSLNPDMIIARNDAGTFIQIAELRANTKNYLDIPPSKNFDDIKASIRMIAEYFNVAQKGEDLIDELEDQVIAVERKREELNILPKVSFVLVNKNGDVMVFGTETDANHMIKISGGYNTMIYNREAKKIDPDYFELSEQDVIFVARRNLEKVGGLESLKLKYKLNKTKAHKNENIVVVDYDMFTSFGTRFPLMFSQVVDTYLNVPVNVKN